MAVRTSPARLLLWLVPAFAAIAALAALVPWVLGIPGDPRAAYAEGWRLGLLALLGYLCAYAVAIVLWPVARFTRLATLASLTHGFIWLTLITMVAAQSWAWSIMLAA